MAKPTPKIGSRRNGRIGSRKNGHRIPKGRKNGRRIPSR